MRASGKNSAPDESLSSRPPGRQRHRVPPLKALLAFEAAARHESFARGAEELGVTPSAISHQLHVLEAFLGVRLFERHAGRASLTAEGRLYSRELERAFAEIAGATALVAPQSRHEHLRIAAGPSFAAKWLQPRLGEFQTTHPHLKIRLSTLSSSAELDAISFDVGIAYERPPATRHDIEPLLVEHVRPLCSPALAERLGLQEPRDLARATLIHSRNAVTWSDYFHRVGVPHLRPADEFWIDRSSMAIDAAVAGRGVILESEILTEDERRQAKLIVPFDAPEARIEAPSYYLVRPRSPRRDASGSAFVRWIRRRLGTGDAGRGTGASL